MCWRSQHRLRAREGIVLVLGPVLGVRGCCADGRTARSRPEQAAASGLGDLPAARRQGTGAQALQGPALPGLCSAIPGRAGRGAMFRQVMGHKIMRERGMGTRQVPAVFDALGAACAGGQQQAQRRRAETPATLCRQMQPPHRGDGGRLSRFGHHQRRCARLPPWPKADPPSGGPARTGPGWGWQIPSDPGKLVLKRLEENSSRMVLNPGLVAAALQQVEAEIR